LSFTFFSEGQDCLFADGAGRNLQIKKWNGERMERFNVNMAKSFLGKNVNLHLKDGSVIINVQFSELLKDEFTRETSIRCVAFRKENEFKIPLRSIAWAEQLNLNLFLTCDKN
jgi:hypothetical protein